jgi:GT2 family glycosyltransferase
VNGLISVVTLTHNKLEYTKLCLTSLLATDHTPWELIVVDNGSTDGTQEWLETFAETAGSAGVTLKTVLNDSNAGCSTARNAGASRASGDKIVFMDNDVGLRSPNWLKIFSEKLDADDVNAVVGPKLVYPFEPYDIQCAGVAISPSGRVQFRGRGASREDKSFAVAGEMQCLISACFMVKRQAFEEADGFDEAFNPVEFEDFDLCYRIRSNGHKVLYEPSVEMYHFESVTTNGTPSIPNTYIIIKHGLEFKKRWRHMFKEEGGPPDEETKWLKIPAHSLAELKDMPLLNSKGGTG